jgi:hypothetical protein
MARKLKTYQTSLGFFDLAMAAPSMKAALEAWGADSNLFHQGAAKESHDPDVIAATMAKPGVVLRRPVGTDRPFSEHAELPTDLGGGRPMKAAHKSKGPKAKKPSSRPVDKAAERKAALAYEQEQRRRELERAREETASGLPPSRPRSRLLRRDRKPKKPAGIRRRSDWKPRCGAREVSFCGGTDRRRPTVPFIVRVGTPAAA